MPEPYSDSSIGVGDGDAAWELRGAYLAASGFGRGNRVGGAIDGAARQGVGDYDPEES